MKQALLKGTLMDAIPNKVKPGCGLHVQSSNIFFRLHFHVVQMQPESYLLGEDEWHEELKSFSNNFSGNLDPA